MGSATATWRRYDCEMDHTHCLSPARARDADAAVTSSSYARLFPDLPAFTADEAFLYALGRAGGLCDCGEEEDDEASLGTEAAGWPFFANSSRMTSRQIARLSNLTSTRHGSGMRDRRN